MSSCFNVLFSYHSANIGTVCGSIWVSISAVSCGGSSLHPQYMRQVFLTSQLKLLYVKKWEIRSSVYICFGEHKVFLRFLPGLQDTNFVRSTLWIENNTCHHLWFILNFVEDVTALTSAHKENLGCIVLNHCLLQTHPAHFLIAWDFFSHIWILNSLSPSTHLIIQDDTFNTFWLLWLVRQRKRVYFCWLTNF
jgi:hypothetical protein